MDIEELEKRLRENDARILSNKVYLNSKDYQTIRESQGGEPMAEETKTKCAAAREEINTLEEENVKILAEIERLKAEEEHHHEDENKLS